jgi:hypothetical protein
MTSEMIRCPSCGEVVTPSPFCGWCRAPLVVENIADLFDSAQRAQSHTESDEPAPIAAAPVVVAQEIVAEPTPEAPARRFWIFSRRKPDPVTLVEDNASPVLGAATLVVPAPGVELFAEGAPHEPSSEETNATPRVGGLEKIGQLVRARPLVAGISAMAVALGVSALACVLVISTLNNVSPDRPTPTAAAATAATLPGWSDRSAWSIASEGTAVSFDGKAALIRNGSKLTVIDPSTGKRTDSHNLPSPALGVLAGYSGDEPVVVGYSAEEVVLWGAQGHPTRFDLEDGQKVVSRSGQIFIDSGTFVELLTPSGLTPFIPPREGVSLFGANDSEMVRWASARGTVITGDLTGGILSETALVAPADGATVAGWVASVNDVTVTRWNTPAGLVLATHTTTTGALIATAPVTAPDGKSLFGPGRTEMVEGGHIVNLVDGSISAVPEGFVPSLYLGFDLFGTNAGTSAIFSNGTVTDADAAPEVVPVGVASGVLLATSGDQLFGFPATNPRPTGAVSTPTTGGKPHE